jgi:hypothetical protein
MICLFRVRIQVVANPDPDPDQVFLITNLFKTTIENHLGLLKERSGSQSLKLKEQLFKHNIS